MSPPPAYLTEYLNKIAKDEGFVEHTLNYESGSNHGDGFIAIIVAVTIKGKRMIDGDDNEEVLSLICKLLPENKARREFFNSRMLFEREVYVYSRALPMFEQFQIERNISRSDGFFQYPKCYLAVADAANDRYAIIMENFKVSNYELWDKMKPVDFDTSSIFLQTLGRYHGISLALRDQRPELFGELLDLDDILLAMVELPNITNMMHGAIDKAIEFLMSKDEKNILRNIRDDYESWIKKLFAPNAAGQLAVLLHGDCWNNNFCFKSDANIESLDDHSGRLLIKLALGSTKDWFNEFMVQPVSKAEYAQYGKVLNYAKYEEYKKKQEDKERLENLKIEKADSSESTSKSYPRHSHRSDSSPTPEEANERQRISSSNSRKYQQHADKHSSHRDRSYSASDDDRKQTDRTSKNHSSRRDSSPETSTRKSKHTSNRKPSDDSDSDRRGKYSSSSRSSHKKTKSKKHFKSRSYSKDHRQRYHSSDEEQDKHYNKKTKKSKRARSRSRDRR